MSRILILCLVFALLPACTSVRLTDDNGERHQYFGFVELVIPKVKNDIQAYKVTSFGVAIERGLSVGWRDNERVLVPLKEPENGTAPFEATCSTIIIIRSSSDAKHAAEMLRAFEGEEICLAAF